MKAEAAGHETLFEQTARQVRNHPKKFRNVSDVIAATGLTRDETGALFIHHAHESPDAFLRRARVELSCRLLREGAEPGAAIEAAGFDGEVGFHRQFVAITGLTPAGYGALRNTAEFTLALPSGYRVQEVLAFHGRDPENLVPDGLRMRIPNPVEIRFADGRARCRTDRPGWAVHQAVARMLGLNCDAAGFERQFTSDALLGSAIARQRGLRIPLAPTVWEALAWAIVGQQINLTFAIALRRGLIEAAGQGAHPTAEQVAALDVDTLRKRKFSGSKAEYLLGAARAVAAGDLPIEGLRDLSVHHAARVIGAVRGIGPWTVQYAFLRGFGFSDCLPSGDAGLAQGLARLMGERPTEPAIRALMAKYEPWRSLATCHIWASLKGNP